MSVLLLTATVMEQGRLAEAMAAAVTLFDAGRRRIAGRLAGRDVELVETGLGSVNTASALTRRLEAESPDIVLQVGVGGAYAGSGLHVGAVAVADSEFDADLGVITSEGWRPTDEIGLPVVERDGQRWFNRFPVDDRLSAEAARCLEAPRGPFLTVQACSGTTALGAERAARVPGALCESMEGAAAAQVCLAYGAPFLEVRAISNLVEDRDLSRWDLPGACARAQEAALHLLRDLPR
jgi:futalosine hydrolase